VFQGAQHIVLGLSPLRGILAIFGRFRFGSGGDELRIRKWQATFEAKQNGRRCGGERSMTAFEEHRDELEHYETMMGPNRGRLAVTLDLLTNALVLVGQHGVYCHSNWNPEQPVMDIRIVTQEISKAKELIQSVMESLRAEREAKRP
jgi:hypothetical protein